MPVIIGTDEAGYGPKLGPLVISASIWHVPEGMEPESMYEALVAAVAPAPDGTERVAICDSKQLYRAEAGLGDLEASVLSCLQLAGVAVSSWRAYWEHVATDRLEQANGLDWYRSYNERLPVAACPERIARGADQLARAVAGAGMRLLSIRSLILTAPRFNQLLRAGGNKSTLLSEATLRLVADVMSEFPDEAVWVRCDKHGGRNRYAGVLQQTFAAVWIEVGEESRAISRYRWQRGAGHVEFEFRAKGECMLPAALASMASKYFRELAMRALNAYWKQHCPELRPTAGYPTDASRFFRDIQDQRSRLQVSDQLLWRAK